MHASTPAHTLPTTSAPSSFGHPSGGIAWVVAEPSASMCTAPDGPEDPAAAAAAAEAAAAAAREREEGRGYIGVEEEPEMVSASSALPLESFFQSVFLSEADGAWYLRLKHEDRQGRPHSFSEALGGFEAFLRQQVRRLPLCAEVACMHIACAPIACACASHARVHRLCVSAVSRGR